MATAHKVLLGILSMVLAGVAVTAEMIFSMVMLQMKWPYWRITSISCVISALPMLISLIVTKARRPSAYQVKWIILMALFSVLYWGLGILAVQVGVDPGDVAALTSINIVAAAVMGRMFLQEHIHVLHFFAVVLSVSGAVLVAQPAFLFASGKGKRGPSFGYACAIASGFLQGFFFICSRKAGDVPAALLNMSVLSVGAVLTALLPFVPLVDEAPFSVATSSSPWAVAGWTGVAVLTTMGSTFFSTAGSMLCPAAISATVYTAASMFFGYLAQTLIFGSTPVLLSILGAVLMLVAVAIMALASRDAPAASEEATDGGAVKRTVSELANATRTVDEDEDDTESITSFMASEVTDFSFKESVRFRGQNGRGEAASVSPQQVGLPTFTL
eukprot:TRINITY_DN10607_c0_g2_i2.p1 TRINITY_DN10607_c0_g2~~TRINITY_DN10607_c0_g2_i2.p1  ORF type:complete len:386 (+),score=48.75 TRINITY_DN10607_c0_g2_i2:62-1219(+)